MGRGEDKITQKLQGAPPPMVKRAGRVWIPVIYRPYVSGGGALGALSPGAHLVQGAAGALAGVIGGLCGNAVVLDGPLAVAGGALDVA